MYNLVTAFSYLASLSTIALCFLELNLPPWLIPIPALLGWLSSMVLIKAITNNIHLAANAFGLMSIGFALDEICKTLPFFSIAFVFLGIASVARLVFFKRLGYVKLLWMEPLALIIGIAIYVTVNLVLKPGWYGWVFPVPLILFDFSLLKSSFTEADIFRKAAKKELGVVVGEAVPDFNLKDQDDQDVTLSEFRDIQPILLLFVRGDWCPTCHIMLRTYEKNNDQFKKRNVMILAIGPDPQGVNSDMVKKLSLSYRILADVKQEALQLFGIQFKESVMGQEYPVGSPLPASVLIDKKGIVKHICRSDRAEEFLNPMQLFAVLEKI